MQKVGPDNVDFGSLGELPTGILLGGGLSLQGLVLPSHLPLSPPTPSWPPLALAVPWLEHLALHTVWRPHQAKKEAKEKADRENAKRWNSLYINTNTVVDTIASRLNVLTPAS